MIKNVKVETVKEMVNSFLKNSHDDRRASRSDMSSLLESILFSSKNYRGFRYLTATDMKTSDAGKTVGINEESFKDESIDMFAGTDGTRVYYL